MAFMVYQICSPHSEKRSTTYPIISNFFLIVTRGILTKHKSDIDLILGRLDEENLAIKIEKFGFARSNVTWLGYNINQPGISPNNEKTESRLK